jgi:valyl-tRNA synthetase
MKIKLIANRDNGYEESYKFFEIHKEYLKLTESVGPNSEFYSDDEEVNQMEEEVRNSYKEFSDEDFIEDANEKPEIGLIDDDYESLLNSM